MAVMLNPGLIKHAFAFNEDVDIFNEKEVMWAIATRSQWDKDEIVIPRSKVGSLDPSAGLAGENAAGGLDCTIPWNESYEVKVYVEPEILDRVKLKDYVSGEALAAVQIDRAQEED